MELCDSCMRSYKTVYRVPDQLWAKVSESVDVEDDPEIVAACEGGKTDE